MRNLLLLLLKAYRYLVSPWLGSRCRFYPSCSEYAQEAISEQGPLKGSWLSVKRVCRCHPWCDGGYDPVPKSK